MLASAPLRLRLTLRRVGAVLLIVGIVGMMVLMFVLPVAGRGWASFVALACAAGGSAMLMVPGRTVGPPTPRRHYAITFAGVFATFASLGPLLMVVFSKPPPTFVAGLVAAMLAGSFAVLWSAAFVLRAWWFVPLAVLLQIVVPRPLFEGLARVGLLNNFGNLDEQTRLGILVFQAVACVVVGYVLVVRLTRVISQEGARSEAELAVARRVHETIVPDLSVATTRCEVFGKSHASSEMGGDLIDAVGGDERVDVYLADVSGHGVGAGIVMAMVKSSIRTRLRQDVSLNELLDDLNVVLSDLVKPGMFATLAWLRLGPGVLEYALAGHLPILLHRASDGRVVDLPNDHLPLAIEPSQKHVSGSTRVAPGDTLLIFTDGLIEVQDARGRQLSLEAFRAAFGAVAARPLQDVHDELLTLARRHGPQVDDQSLVLVRIR